MSFPIGQRHSTNVSQTTFPKTMGKVQPSVTPKTSDGKISTIFKSTTNVFALLFQKIKLATRSSGSGKVPIKPGDIVLSDTEAKKRIETQLDASSEQPQKPLFSGAPILQIFREKEISKQRRLVFEEQLLTKILVALQESGFKGTTVDEITIFLKNPDNFKRFETTINEGYKLDKVTIQNILENLKQSLAS